MSTRTLVSGYTRTRECFNLHRFTTREVLIPPAVPQINSRLADSYKGEIND